MASWMPDGQADYHFKVACSLPHHHRLCNAIASGRPGLSIGCEHPLSNQSLIGINAAATTTRSGANAAALSATHL